MALETHPAGSNDSENKAIIVRDDRKSPSVELSLGICLSSSPPLITSESIRLQSTMNVEAGRCRRTDGRKWRCRREVIPDHKYCERHIHRGRQHSTNSDFKVIGKSLKIKKGCQENVETRGHDRRVPLEFSFSPKSVLRQENVGGSSASSNDPSTQRCRRTDGKKWQCSRDVIPTQKYCLQHMHRGAKKVTIAKNSQKSNSCLSFSVEASFKKTGNDGNLSSEAAEGGSSSEATTVSM